MNSIFKKVTLDVCSVDWDYMFPNAEPYDWGADEGGGIYLQFVWATRAGNRPITDPNAPQAVRAMVPDKNKLEGFWERTVIGSPLCLAIAESHSDAYQVVKSLGVKNVRVVNYDAHHDAGYSKKSFVDCGNWASKLHEEGLLKEYTVVYPEWRKEAREPKPLLERTKIVYQPPAAKRYDVVFVCRSGQWTPTWADGDWIRFIEWWKRRFKFSWNEKISAPFALKKRSPTREESIKNARAWDKLVKDKFPKVETA